MSPKDYRGITQLNITLMIFKKVILEEVNTVIHRREDHEKNQEDSKKQTNRICYLHPKKIIEKSLTFNHPEYICFVNMTKTFDRERLAYIIKILHDKEVNKKIIQIIYDININCKTTVRTGQLESKGYIISRAIRQADSSVHLSSI